METEQAAKTLDATMIAAHKDQFGEVSVKMRHYIHGLAAELTTRMGFTREVYTQPKDSLSTLMSVPVEQKWEET